MFKNWFAPKKSKTQLGIYLKPNAVILLSLNSENAEQYSAKVSGSDGWSAAIKSLLEKHQIKATTCQFVLASNFYQKYTIEKPQVAEQDIAAAIPWALKDIINEPLHEIVSDYYESVTVANTSEKLNIITARRSLISSLVNISREMNLQLQSITIEEMALTNLVSVKDETTILLSQEPNEELSLLTVNAGKLLFNRRLRGFSQLSSLAKEDIDQLLIDNLSLELQRSLDYLVAQLKQTDIRRIDIAIQTPALDTICSALNEVFSLPVVPFKHPRLNPNISLISLGAALEISHE